MISGMLVDRSVGVAEGSGKGIKRNEKAID